MESSVNSDQRWQILRNDRWVLSEYCKSSPLSVVRQILNRYFSLIVSAVCIQFQWTYITSKSFIPRHTNTTNGSPTFLNLRSTDFNSCPEKNYVIIPWQILPKNPNWYLTIPFFSHYIWPTYKVFISNIRLT